MLKVEVKTKIRQAETDEIPKTPFITKNTPCSANNSLAKKNVWFIKVSTIIFILNNTIIITMEKGNA